ncbi:type VI secretion system-associated FHA domain protein TagH [Caulobacter sp. S45]|uniref:type VI secretion system-associated FHA domain protein TagH n=1 Tax=Caulobacter sp. S45 TaxID=1641861 RepID=UPI00157775FF|nr:type VI secretion system-associated FHA domain protein TagH [Caulobacter sp. S45]
MIALRLFSAADPSRQIDVRVLGEREEVTLGRDAAAGWALPDPDRALSRLHLKVGVRDGAVSVTDTSTNGVTSATQGGRLPRDQPVRVEPGERLELGPYVLLIERSDHVSAPAPQARREDANPFAPMGGSEEPPERRQRVDPFASGMAPDPLAADPFADDGLGLGPLGRSPARSGAGLSGGDAWERRDGGRAGDWNAGPTRAEPVIGAPQAWREPPARDADDGGFGFDAPFRQPILRAPDLAASDLAIPSDWDAAPPSHPEPADQDPAPAPPSPFDAPAKGSEDLEPRRRLSPRSELVEGRGVHHPREGTVLRQAQDEAEGEGGEPAVEPGESAPAIKVKPATPPPAAPAPSPPSAPAAPGASSGLFEAFCAGAKLDPAALAGEDQAAMMERLGAVYRHMVLGLSDVLGERTALKNEYRMVRTTIQADENNPFKWAPPQKVASELLRAANDGFLDGPAAVAESYQDVKKHLLCMLAGLRAALSSSLDTLAPAQIEEAIKDQSFVLKPRAAVAWAEYVKVYGQYRREAEDSADSPVNRAFRAAYEKQLDELDRMALR